MVEAHAYWLAAPGRGEIRAERLRAPGPEEVLVRTLRSAISRGTETLVFRGGVPADQHQTMRAPFQEGDFPGPVKYGYLSVGLVEQGPPHLRGRRVFCLHPHQTAYVVPAAAVVLVPDDVPTPRAVLAGTVETALNAVWDADLPRDARVAVVGAGMVGCAVARLLVTVAGADVVLVDVDPARSEVAAAIGVELASPDHAPGELDLVVHTSATSAGLQRSLELLATEGTVLELSWYGDRPVTLDLGGAFHSRRLAIRASQVGMVAPARRDHTSHRDRLALALDHLWDPAFDALISGCSPFAELPEVMAALAGGQPALCHTIDYEESPL